VGWDSIVGIATRYRLDGPWIESRWGRDFQCQCRPALGPTQPPIQGVPGLLGVKRPGCGVHHPSSARVKERVELYLYCPSGPSWPVLGRTLPLPLLFTMCYKGDQLMVDRTGKTCKMYEGTRNTQILVICSEDSA
jgi:hypothetical protein